MNQTRSLLTGALLSCLMLTSFLLPRPVTAREILTPEQKANLDAVVNPLIEGEWIQGLAIGVATESGTQTFSYGHVAGADSPPPDGQTLWEIGSMSKVFTGVLLADAATAGQVDVNDPVNKYLPPEAQLPQNDGADVLLWHLATHTSGLPRLPSNMELTDLVNPYAAYTFEQLLAYLPTAKYESTVGKKHSYSNLGIGLLGYVLARRADVSYEELLAARLLKPLGMDSTCITLDDERRARMAAGHNSDGDEVGWWDLPTLAGAGAIRSTADDMLKFLSANAGMTDSELLPAFKLSHEPRFTINEGMKVGLCWNMMVGNGVVWHNGETGGFHAFGGFHPEKKLAVVVLANSACRYVDPLAQRVYQLLLNKPAEPLKLRATVSVEPEKLSPLVGKYLLSLTSVMEITQEADQLYLQLTGQPRFKLFASEENKFFLRVVEAEVVFERDADGTCDKLVLHQNGLKLPAARITAKEE